MEELKFGTAGVPISSKDRSTIGGIREVGNLDLDAMEIEFVRGVRMSIDAARKVKEVATENGVTLTAHGPYYINLLSSDKDKIEASVKRILDTAKVAYEAGGYSITFHAAYYGNFSKEEAFKKVKEKLRKVVKNLEDEGVKIWIRPETTGKDTQFGTLEEVIGLSEEIESIMPCLDFAHIHARSRGKFNSFNEFCSILEKIERRLGKDALHNMHIHFSGIEYGEKGERKHLNLEESDFNYVELLKAFREFNVKGVAISESPNIEGDALLMKKLWKSL